MANPEDPPIDYAALAARYLELWQEQVAKLGQDPAAAATYMDAWSKMFGAAGMPSLFAGLMPHVPSAARPSPQNRTATSAATHGDGDVDHAALLRRLDAVERRLAALEGAGAAEPAAQSSSAGTGRKPKPSPKPSKA